MVLGSGNFSCRTPSILYLSLVPSSIGSMWISEAPDFTAYSRTTLTICATGETFITWLTSSIFLRDSFIFFVDVAVACSIASDTSLPRLLLYSRSITVFIISSVLIYVLTFNPVLLSRNSMVCRSKGSVIAMLIEALSYSKGINTYCLAMLSCISFVVCA